MMGGAARIPHISVARAWYSDGMLRTGRWDWLEGLRPQSAAEVVVAEMAKVLAGTLRDWPPDLEWTDDAARARYAPVLAPGAPRPSLAAIREGLRLACLEMDREVEAIDYYLRNDGGAAACNDARDRLALELTWKLATEWMWELAEVTEGRVKRALLKVCLEKAAGLLATN